jgi:hypothetical protein
LHFHSNEEKLDAAASLDVAEELPKRGSVDAAAINGQGVSSASATPRLLTILRVCPAHT